MGQKLRNCLKKEVQRTWLFNVVKHMQRENVFVV